MLIFLKIAKSMQIRVEHENGSITTDSVVVVCALTLVVYVYFSSNK